MYPQFGQFYKKVVLRLSEHGDVIETQTIRFVPTNFFSKLGPCYQIKLFIIVDESRTVISYLSES